MGSDLLYVMVPLMLLVAVGLAWAWWATRSERDPAASVGSFHRALEAMQPGAGPIDRKADPRQHPAVRLRDYPAARRDR